MRFISLLTFVILANVGTGHAADIASILTGKNATSVQFQVSKEDITNAKSFDDTNLPPNTVNKTFSIYGVQALKSLDAGCTVILKGEIKEGAFSGKVNFLKVAPAQLFASEIRIGFRGDSTIESVVCHYNEAQPPSLEKISAELKGQIAFTDLSDKTNPLNPEVKSLSVDQDVALHLSEEDRTAFLGAVSGKILPSSNKKSQYNRCTLVSYDPTDVMTLKKGDTFNTSNPAVALVFSSGIEYTATSVDVKLKRTGEFYELNCIETNVDDSTLESALQKHFVGILTAQ